MAFKIVKADITKLKVDAIVNPTDQHYSGGGGVDMQINDICGQELRKATYKLPKLHLGEAKATDGFDLPCKYIIHTSGPHWTGRSNLELAVLGSCYRNSVALANSKGCKSIAFPLIASSGKHFPKEVAFTVALNAIKECVEEYPDIEITLTIWDERTDKIPDTIFDSVTDSLTSSYIPSEAYVEDLMPDFVMEEVGTYMSDCDYDIQQVVERFKDKTANAQLDENFASMLNRLFREKGFKVTQIQDEVGLSGAALSKLRNGLTNPKRLTVFAFAIAFKLNIEETKDFLMKAGYAINKSSAEDVILEGFIKEKIYDRNQIDDVLYAMDLVPLPGC